MNIRPVRREDAREMLDIYSPFVTDSCVSFELETPSIEEFERRVESYSARYPWLVAEEEGSVMGYAYASSYRERKAYQWAVECSVYIRADKRGSGIGRALYNALFSELKHRGYFNVYAIITLPNDSSVNFHRSMNFEDVGVFRRVGFKFGSWHDVLWMVHFLREESVPDNYEL